MIKKNSKKTNKEKTSVEVKEIQDEVSQTVIVEDNVREAKLENVDTEHAINIEQYKIEEDVYDFTELNIDSLKQILNSLTSNDWVKIVKDNKKENS